MKVFISQPMKGREPDAVYGERAKILEYVKKLYPEENVVLINSYFGKVDANPLRLLGASIELMSDADLVVFAQDWSVARGCQIEHECAKRYDLKILDLED